MHTMQRLYILVILKILLKINDNKKIFTKNHLM